MLKYVTICDQRYNLETLQNKYNTTSIKLLARYIDAEQHQDNERIRFLSQVCGYECTTDTIN